MLSQQDFPDFGMKKLNLYYVTLTNYDESFQNVKVIFDEEVLQETMGEVLERAGRTQIRIAETEKISLTLLSSFLEVEKKNM